MTLTSIPLPIIAAIITAVITSIIGPTVVEWVKMKFQSLKPGKDILGEAIKNISDADQNGEYSGVPLQMRVTSR